MGEMSDRSLLEAYYGLPTGLMMAFMSEDAEAAPMGTLGKALGKKTRKAYHGSPHDFDKFSLKHIGTGEGAQAYGHGLYFTSKEDIAKFYRDELRAPQRIRYKGDKVTLGVLNDGGRDTATNLVLRLLNDNRLDVESGDLSGVRATLKQMADNPDWATSAKRGLDKLDDIAQDVDFGDPARLYTVEIPDESLMLDWDKPLNEQPQNVQRALRKLERDEGVSLPKFDTMGNVEPTGRDAYGAIAGSHIPHMGDRAGASAKLRELGIPGITYKGATSGERNFVVFDDELINVIEKGQIDPRILPFLAGAGAAGVAAQNWGPGELGKAAGSIGSGMLGGLVGDLSRVGGYLNPFMPVESTEAGAQALSDKLQYMPTDNAYMRALYGGVEDAMAGLANSKYLSPEAWEASIPGKIYNALPERAKGLVRIGADWLL